MASFSGQPETVSTRKVNHSGFHRRYKLSIYNYMSVYYLGPNSRMISVEQA